jgi:hypothetical protein
MDPKAILGILAVSAGVVVAAIGFLLLMTWPYPLEVMAVFGGPLLVGLGVVALRSPRRVGQP